MDSVEDILENSQMATGIRLQQIETWYLKWLKAVLGGKHGKMCFMKTGKMYLEVTDGE